jgi:lipoprotein-anchoring transpeptidase ErfK/SrfK
MTNKTFIAVTGVLAALIVAGGAIYAWDSSKEDQIAEDVKVGGIAIGGMSAEAARAKLERSLLKPLDENIVVKKGGKEFELTPKQARVAMNLDAMVDQALERSREGNVLERTFRSLTGDGVKADLPARVSYSQPAVNRLVRKVKRSVNRAPRDASIEASGGGLDKVRSRTGLAVKTGALRSALEATLTQPDAEREISVQTRKIRPKVTVNELADKYPHYLIVDRDNFTVRYYRNLKLEKNYTVAIGAQGFDTASGLYDIQNKQVNPSWHVPNSAWAGGLAGQVIPPGPDNPLKARWMAFNGSAGFHGTADTGSLGSRASHGCIRMAVPDVIDLYDRIDVGTPVYIA